MELKPSYCIYTQPPAGPFNRTLWNWNPVTVYLCVRSLCKLLIVPYGIETHSVPTLFLNLVGLLIVPYGIETRLRQMCQEPHPAFNRTLWNWNRIWKPSSTMCANLLIVPYGIETESSSFPGPSLRSFNRTLWNWNSATICLPVSPYRSFNRTLWNWNAGRVKPFSGAVNF